MPTAAPRVTLRRQRKLVRSCNRNDRFAFRFSCFYCRWEFHSLEWNWDFASWGSWEVKDSFSRRTGKSRSAYFKSTATRKVCSHRRAFPSLCRGFLGGAQVGQRMVRSASGCKELQAGWSGWGQKVHPKLKVKTKWNCGRDTQNLVI